MNDLDSTISLVSDALSHLSGFRVKKMFGGASVYSDDVVFCMITSEAIPHFRIGAGNLTDFQSEGMEPFVHISKKGKRTEMPYYTIPERLWSNQKELETWVQKSVAEAVRAKK